MSDTLQKFCKEHQAPLVEVNGQRVCIAEYFKACIGSQKIVNVIRTGKIVWYVFEDGHAVPLLCFCCGKPLNIDNFVKERQDMIGRRLVGTGARMVRMEEDGKEHLQFFIDLSPKDQLSSKGLSVLLSVNVAAYMYHPEGCPRKPEKLDLPLIAQPRKRKR